MSHRLSKKTLFKNTLEFLGVYVLSIFLVLFALGYVPKEKERLYFSSLILTIVIFGAYETGKSNKIV